MIKQCAVCHTPFDCGRGRARMPYAKTCSDACSEQFLNRHKKTEPLVCLVCHKTFTPRAGRDPRGRRPKTCSASCRRVWHKRTYTEWAKKNPRKRRSP